MANELIKFNITLPANYDRWLRLWAYAKGIPRATLVNNTIQARIEANKQIIIDLLQEIADHEGITLEDLKKEILKEKNNS